MESQSTQQPTQTKKPSSGIKKKVKAVSQETDTPIMSSITETQVSESVAVSEPVATTPVATVSEPVSVPETITESDQEFTSIIDFINLASDKLAESNKYVKEAHMNKDQRSKFEASLKKVLKSMSLVQTTFYDNMSKQLSSLEKNSHGKSSGVKKTTDKDKAAIHKLLPVYPFFLKFLKLEEGTLVSRATGLKLINSYVKEEKLKNPDLVIHDDKKSFMIFGELETLFAEINKVMISRNVNEEIPKHIKYTDIMKYMSYCYVKTD